MQKKPNVGLVKLAFNVRMLQNPTLYGLPADVLDKDNLLKDTKADLDEKILDHVPIPIKEDLEEHGAKINDMFNNTAKAVEKDEEPVALQVIEFWSSISDEEIYILEYYGGDFTADSKIPCFYFIKQALPALVPMLLETLWSRASYIGGGGGGCSEGSTSCKGGGDTTPCNVGRGGVGEEHMVVQAHEVEMQFDI
ncbi:importin subunit beta-1 [Tanacetum coccineum]